MPGEVTNSQLVTRRLIGSSNRMKSDELRRELAGLASPKDSRLRGDDGLEVSQNTPARSSGSVSLCVVPVV